jgi:hypothetical protein
MVVGRTGHGLSINDMVIVRNTNVAAFNSYITAVDANTFTVNCPDSGATTGTTGSYTTGLRFAHNSSTPGSITSGTVYLPSNGELVELLAIRIYFASNTRQTTTYNFTIPNLTVGLSANTGFNDWYMPVDKVRAASTSSPSVVASTLASIATSGDWNTFQLGALGLAANPIIIQLQF